MKRRWLLRAFLGLAATAVVVVGVWLTHSRLEAKTLRSLAARAATIATEPGARLFQLSFEDRPFGTISAIIKPAPDGLELEQQARFAYRLMQVQSESFVSATATFDGNLRLQAYQQRQEGAPGVTLNVTRGTSLSDSVGTFTWLQGGEPVTFQAKLQPDAVPIDSGSFFGAGLEVLARRLDFSRLDEQIISLVDPPQVISTMRQPMLVLKVPAKVLGIRSVPFGDGRRSAVAVEFVWPAALVRCYFGLDNLQLLGWELPKAGVVVTRLPVDTAVALEPVDASKLMGLANQGAVVRLDRDPGPSDRFSRLDLGVDLWVLTADRSYQSTLTQSGQTFRGTAAGQDGLYHVQGSLSLIAPSRAFAGVYPTDDGTPLLSSPADVDRAYLAAEPFIEADAPDIQAQAEAILNLAFPSREGITRWQVSKTVAAWVYKNVEYRITGGTARQALAMRVGDCAPHTYLTVALLRSLGVPARPVIGMIITKGVAGQHLWAEVFLGQEIGWVPLDPTSGEIENFGATHLKVLGNSGILAPAFGLPKVTVIAVDPGEL